MFWRKSNSSTRMRNIAFRALFASGCFSAFVIFGWGVEVRSVIEVLLLLIFVVLAMIIPAALFVGVLKLFSYALKRFRSEES